MEVRPRIFESPTAAGGGVSASPDDDRRFLNKGGLDAVSMPELVNLLEAKTPKDVRKSARDFITTVVRTDAKSFGVDYKFETQTVLKVLEGQFRSALNDAKGDLAKEYERCADEISTVSQLLYWNNVFNSVGKSMSDLGSQFDKMSTGTMITPDTYQNLFTLPSENMMTNTDLGSKIDKVVRACIIVGLCEDPKKLKEMRNKSGWKLLFENDAKEKEFLGNIDEWDPVRTVKKDPGTNMITYDSLKKERDSGFRVGISKNGNLWARPETMNQSRSLKREILRLVDNDELAYHLGMAVFKIWGMDAEHAAMTILEDEKETVVFEGYPNSTDLGKLFHFALWQKKQDRAGHPCGPKETRGNIKKLLSSFPKFVVITEDDGNKHTLHEEMWGFGSRDAVRLGEANWGEVQNDDMNNWGSRINVPAGGDRGNGLFPWLKAEKADADALTSVQFWQLLTLNLNVVVNEQLVADGELYGKNQKELAEMVKQERRSIVKTFWEGVKALPDYPVWASKPVIANANQWGSHAGIASTQFIRDYIWKPLGIDYLKI